MKRKTRALSLILTVCMFVLVAAGCSSSSDSSNAKASGNGKTSTDTISFSIALQSEGVDNTQSMIQKEWQKLMEQKLGKKLDIKWNYIPSSDYDQKVKLMIASNELPDLFMTPLFYDTTSMSSQGQILELSQYKDLMPNYMKYIASTKNGMSAVTDQDEKMYFFKETSTPRFPADKGMLIQNVSAYRYDLFQKNNIKIPTTWDELYNAAKTLKELYPDKYPINTRWNDLRSLFNANHVVDDVYWDGSKYVYGPFQDGYKTALEFANKLYKEKLLDPEFLTDTDDTVKQKALNGDNFIWLAQWFTDPAVYTRTANDGKIFAVTLYPDNPTYGKSWQTVVNGNTPDLGWATLCISSKAKDPEDLVKLIDLQYDPEVIRLLTWGIEGTTYQVDANGNPSFTDEFKKAEDPWKVGDKYGIRASTHYRPGLQISSDSKAFVDFAPNDYTYFDGKYEETPIEKSPFLLSLPMPNNPYIPSTYSAPTIQFTQDESQQISEIMTPIKTYVQQEVANFVFGNESFDKWPQFIDKIKSMGDMDKVLKIYNDAAARVTAK